MTKEEFNQITEKIGCWFAHKKLNSFRRTFGGDEYPSSLLVTDYNLFIDTLKATFISEPSLPADLDEAASAYENDLWELGFKDLGYVYEAFKAGAEWMAGQGVSLGHLIDWYVASVDNDAPIWTEEHLKELTKDFVIIPKASENNE